jgi:hypothetical protein
MKESERERLLLVSGKPDLLNITGIFYTFIFSFFPFLSHLSMSLNICHIESILLPFYIQLSYVTAKNVIFQRRNID